MTRAVRSVLLPFLLCLCAIPGDLGAADQDDVQAKVAAAIDSLRGADLSGMSSDEKKALGKRLDDAWDFILDHPKEAKPAVRAALAAEHEDNYRIIDLTHLLVVLDTGFMKEAPAALLRADPNGNPRGYFDLTSWMAARHCAACLPVVLRMLQLSSLSASIPEHALGVDIDLGLLFTIGQYGDAALDGVRAGLGSQDCVTRGNAAFAIGLLLPASEPPALRDIAMADPCEATRGKAWFALGMFDDPSLAGTAVKRLAAAPPPSAEERLAIARALTSSFSSGVEVPLKSLMDDPDSQVAAAARKGLDDFEKEAQTPAEMRKKLGSATRSARSELHGALQRAKSKGHFDFKGDRDAMVAALDPADQSLVNEARAAVLGRLSDECLDEWYDLTWLVRALRAIGAAPPAPVTELR